MNNYHFIGFAPVHSRTAKHYNFAIISVMSGLFLKARFPAKLKCPHVVYVSAFAKDFLASCLELLHGFQNVVVIQASL